MRLQAISAGSRAAPERRFAGVVHSVFRQACNIRADDDGRLLTLLPAQAGNVPHGVRLDVPPGFAFIDHLAVGQPAACRAGVLRFAGAGLAIDLGGARPWRIDVSAPPADLGRPEVAAAWTTAWRGLPRGAERRADDAGLLAHAAARYGLELTVATRRLCLVEAEATVARLVGCGPGLTPAGDDLLVGCMAGLWSTAGADPGRRGFLRGLAAAAVGAAPATGDISRSYLEAAAEGEFAETIAVLARRIADGAAAGEIGRAAADALRVGHTSGADGVRGLLLGLAAWSPAPSPFAALRGLQRALDLMPFTPEGFGRGQEAPTLPLTRVPPSPGFRRGRGGVGALYRVARGWGGSGITASGRNGRHG